MEHIDRYFEGVAWKYLSTVDAEKTRSNQHELGGLVKAGFKQHLGDPGTETLRFPARFILLAEDENESISVDGRVSWYDSRRNQPSRTAELRLYYDSNPVTELMVAGMFLLIAKSRKEEIFIIFSEAESSAEQQLRWLFGLNGEGTEFESKALDSTHERASWASLWILEQLGVEVEPPDQEQLGKILDRFGEAFPPTREFSAFAREVAGELDSGRDPDNSLVTLMDTEERLFRLLERYLVERRLAEGFSEIDTFIKYSLSVQNRRKSRVGYAFENHLEYIFKVIGLRYSRGVYTEHRSKPDFLFPGLEEYQNQGFPTEGLSLLGVKSSCKDRWRQVLSEAKRIPDKHLATLEPGISSFQIAEMQANNLQLVVPSSVHETYPDDKRTWLWSIGDFVGHVANQQRQV